MVVAEFKVISLHWIKEYRLQEPDAALSLEPT
jgi:hypothetical protein